MTFAEEIEREAGGAENILYAVMGVSRKGYNFMWEDEEVSPLANKKLKWAKVRETLNYIYDSGYGGQDCHSVYAWTKDKVIFVSEYDGSTYVTSLPRNPVACEPCSI